MLRRPGPLDVYFRELEGDELLRAERVFFGAIQLSNGTYKTTVSHRLDDLNELVADRLPRGRRLQVMDVAVSSGIATAEWSEHLHLKGINHDLVAGDLAVSAVLLTLGRHVGVLWQEGGHALVVQVGGLCLYLDRPPLITSVPKFALARIYRLLVAHMELAPYEARPVPWRARLRAVGLVSRQLASSSAVRIVTDDIGRADRFQDQADVCRAANVMNRAYFADDVIETMARNLLDRVAPGGLLAVCRTCDDGGHHVNRATLVRRVEGSLEVVARLNGGSEVEDLVLAAGGAP